MEHADSSSHRDALAGVRSIVVKLGTQLLTGRDGQLGSAFLRAVADQVVALDHRGVRVTLVSSGAIGAGWRAIGLAKRPTDLAKLQAVAAIGQRRLMDAWAEAFAPHARHVAQVLLTREDVDDRTRFLNARNTIHAIHELGAIPVLNENDTVSTDEIVAISFGDNDILAASVAQALRADLLVLLSVVDGILDGDGRPVRTVDSIDDVLNLVRTEKSALGKGGMGSKLQAAKTVTDAGEWMVLADGRMENVLTRIVAGEAVGTLFRPAAANGRRRTGRGRWIGSARPAGAIVVDAGAVRAIVEQHKSLLPAGVVAVDGEFARGDVVAIVAADGTPVARGLSNYASGDVRQIAGKKTAAVRAMLAEAAYDEVVHCDNLLVG